MQEPLKVLYISPDNRCRSLMAEAMTRQLSNGRIEAASGGAEPAAEAHPLLGRFLQEAGIRSAGLRPRSWQQFGDYDPDLVISLFPETSRERLPAFLDNAVLMHWPLDSPAALEGEPERQADAFRDCIHLITQWVRLLFEARNRGGLQSRVAIREWLAGFA